MWWWMVLLIVRCENIGRTNRRWEQSPESDLSSCHVFTHPQWVCPEYQPPIISLPTSFMTLTAEMVEEISSFEYRFSWLIFLTWPEGIICLNMKWSGGIGKLVNEWPRKCTWILGLDGLGLHIKVWPSITISFYLAINSRYIFFRFRHFHFR